MVEYIVFLRGVNVGGGKPLLMAELRKKLEADAFTNVKTYIQTGNIRLNSSEKNESKIAARIQKIVCSLIGRNVVVFVFPTAELKSILEKNPFNGIRSPGDERQCIIFLSAKPEKTKIPLYSSIKDAEVFFVRGKIACGFSRGPPGKGGNIGVLLEKAWGVQTTTRFWHTFGKIMGAFA